MHAMFSQMINQSASVKQHNVSVIHNLYEIHRMRGLTAEHLQTFIICLKDTFRVVCPDSSLENNEYLSDLVELLEQLIEHDSICIKFLVSDILTEIDKEGFNKELIKQKIQRIQQIVKQRYDC